MIIRRGQPTGIPEAREFRGDAFRGLLEFLAKCRRQIWIGNSGQNPGMQPFQFEILGHRHSRPPGRNCPSSFIVSRAGLRALGHSGFPLGRSPRLPLGPFLGFLSRLPFGLLLEFLRRRRAATRYRSGVATAIRRPDRFGCFPRLLLSFLLIRLLEFLRRRGAAACYRSGIRNGVATAIRRPARFGCFLGLLLSLFLEFLRRRGAAARYRSGIRNSVAAAIRRSARFACLLGPFLEFHTLRLAGFKKLLSRSPPRPSVDPASSAASHGHRSVPLDSSARAAHIRALCPACNQWHGSSGGWQC